MAGTGNVMCDHPYQRTDQLPSICDLEPEPGSHMQQSPIRQQLLMDESMVPLPVGHPHGHQTPFLVSRQVDSQMDITCRLANRTGHMVYGL